MLQAVLISPGKIELRESPVPEPSDEEVLVRLRCALTCGTDLKAFLRGHPLIPMPGPFGHEFSGSVAMVGRNVQGLQEGDDVMGVHSAPCLSCAYCTKGLYNLCERIMDTKVLGAYAEYLLLPQPIVKQNLYPKPSRITFQEAAILEPLSCVVHPYEKGDFTDIERALVMGAGPIGLLHLSVLHADGVRVCVTDPNPEKLETARRMGASAAITPDALPDLLHTETQGMGMDLLVECTGQVGAWEKSIDLVRRGGTVILFGGCPSGTRVHYATHRLHYDEITIMGSFHFTPADVRKARDLLAEKKFDIAPLITSEYPLEEIGEVFHLLSQGKGIKYALSPAGAYG